MGILKRILGICQTRPPSDGDCWTIQDGTVEIDLARAAELIPKGGAIRLEGEGLPERLLIVHGDDDQMYAFRNKCMHAGRRLDPLAGAAQVQCCSVGHSTWTYDGKRVSGSAKEPLTGFPVDRVDDKLVVRIAR